MTGLTTDEARALFVLAAQGAHAALGLDSALGLALRKVMAALLYAAPARRGADQPPDSDRPGPLADRSAVRGRP